MKGRVVRLGEGVRRCIGGVWGGWVRVMKLLSWNVRGLGGLEKRREVRLLVGEKLPWIVCLQETKLSVCDSFLVSLLWGNSNCNFSFRPSKGASGGILIMWDNMEVEVWSSVSRQHFLLIHDKFLKSNEEFYFFNVYAPCGLREKEALWESSLTRLQLLRGKQVCVCGDFNVVWSVEERRSVRGENATNDHVAFNLFVEDNVLFDLPLYGRIFTWFKGDGSSMSRIDKFLLSEEWCFQWPNCIQAALLRGLLDHCPLVLSVDEANWGPRPNRMLNCWQDIPGYKQFVSDKWKSLHVDGWGVLSFVKN